MLSAVCRGKVRMCQSNSMRRSSCWSSHACIRSESLQISKSTMVGCLKPCRRVLRCKQTETIYHVNTCSSCHICGYTKSTLSVKVLLTIFTVCTALFASICILCAIGSLIAKLECVCLPSLESRLCFAARQVRSLDSQSSHVHRC